MAGVKRESKISIEDVSGFKIGAVKAGLKASGNLDLGVIIADKPAAAAGVFTKNRIVSPTIPLDRKNLKSTGGMVRGVLVNAGCANTCTGRQGRINAEECAKLVAENCDAAKNEILICSTGVIGQQLNMPKMLDGINDVCAKAGKTKAGNFSKAIMTTDLMPKSHGVKMGELGGAVLAGVAKGSGMIAPNMATMLGFILTDVAVSPDVLQAALSEVVKTTFNCVTVDSDTSTNDSVIVLASGAAKGGALKKASGPKYRAFVGYLHEVCLSLAEMIARDGEGATKLIRVNVTGAKSDSDAAKAARTIADSPLVKTAMFGNDPNWGRVIGALGRSGAAVKEASTSMRLCGEYMFRDGTPLDFNAPALSKKMKAKEVQLDVEMGIGKGKAMMLTCDFSYDYVKINAEYHT